MWLDGHAKNFLDLQRVLFLLINICFWLWLEGSGLPFSITFDIIRKHIPLSKNHLAFCRSPNSMRTCDFSARRGHLRLMERRLMRSWEWDMEGMEEDKLQAQSIR
ncbi:hypothetical protein OPV22_032096 [Ensete ventricosum]|uniref:Uncharacterized protein n=1 Tax=Ensete ventricosum TaxID=4639 RepID=A0AAV8PNU7_ENSVE|nr:hypothetical protein OPV22_032096 [Ensete ventricosum]